MKMALAFNYWFPNRCVSPFLIILLSVDLRRIVAHSHW